MNNLISDIHTFLGAVCDKIESIVYIDGTERHAHDKKKLAGEKKGEVKGINVHPPLHPHHFCSPFRATSAYMGISFWIFSLFTIISLKMAVLIEHHLWFGILATGLNNCHSTLMLQAIFYS